MADAKGLALEAARRVRLSRGYAGLGASERRVLDRDLSRIEDALAENDADPYATSLGSPVEEFQRQLAGGAQPSQTAPQAAPPPPPMPASAVDLLGRRTAESLESIDFPRFVAGLVTGTFQAIVDASVQQMREYAQLVASLARTVDDFTRDNVSPNQTRDWLAERHAADLTVALPAAGRQGAPRLLPRPGKADQSPAWLEQYHLGGKSLTPELTDGELVEAARTRVGEERMQHLATLVLMGVNRIVVNDGEIKAKLQFHASATERTRADVGGVSAGGIAARPMDPGGTAMQVSTLRANQQSNTSLRADLVGEVRISFRTETFPLERFADSAAIQLINRHARTPAATAAQGGTPATEAAAPARGGKAP